ncbi:LysM peptidoglycan-binding domain-containing protein [Paenibacillus sp. UNC496MF]|uniref:LysM peptidoglycan-binding domain-containing protein n=1 Tax=Paenibacillus sp. UNC496MF TaxID=1502753 RepID=UPI0015A6A28D|nr:LysM peptidoglycan-binding domain-containing protein [Paenibacillus sp. UNC496MF]
MITKHKMPIAVIGLLILFSAVIWRNVQSDFNNVTWKQYIVGSGDTMWSIAQTSTVDTNTRDIVAVMQDYNEMHNVNLHPGDVILVPMSK